MRRSDDTYTISRGFREPLGSRTVGKPAPHCRLDAVTLTYRFSPTAIILVLIVAGILTENPTIALVVFLLVLLRIVVMGIRVGLDVYSMVTKPDRRKVCVFILLGLWRLRMAWVDKAAEEQKSSQQAPA
ncbi:unnamed protein product [Nippostrongylus brasiliensis]|uniref:DUF3017 domain-containing protein n=1 Tax=Nippostrongylus brasiliensis TaxID=27835 RepID=A0A0N4YX32_NIPBR|nr:unnamed protein product [Nippostrongylus brasiliensis]